MYWFPNIYLHPKPLKTFGCPTGILNSIYLKLDDSSPVGFSSSVNDCLSHINEQGPYFWILFFSSLSMLNQLSCPPYLLLNLSVQAVEMISIISSLGRSQALLHGLPNPLPDTRFVPAPTVENIYNKSYLSVHFTLKHSKSSIWDFIFLFSFKFYSVSSFALPQWHICWFHWNELKG